MSLRALTSLFLLATALTVFGVPAFGDGPKDNVADNVRRVPPPGVAVPDADRAELEAGLKEFAQEIDALRTRYKDKPAMLELLPDVEIYQKAVRDALRYNEIHNLKEIPVAKKLLQQGRERGALLKDGKSPWTTATGLVVRGYVSKIDGSIQPYGLVVPATYHADSPAKHRLDSWFHGRGETLSELNFLQQRQTDPGQFTPPNAFVLHPYGRYCNANKLAGEVDFLEALEHARKYYPIDENRIIVRGFSMGGAACWQFAVHYAGRWAAAAPGAGFAETPDFLKVFQKEVVKPTWFEEKLWHVYDCTDWAVNLYNCPTVAYSGDKDSQKQAADIMAKALAAEGIELVHVIGPNTGHAYEKDAKVEINRRIDSIAARGRNPVPAHVKFTTYTLRYNEMLWVQVDGLQHHWERARVDAQIIKGGVEVTTKNVTGLTLAMPPGFCPLDNTRPPKVRIDDQELEAAAVLSDRSWTAHFSKSGDRWSAIESIATHDLRKVHGLQGPIDDAFMDAFVMVRPTGKPLNEKVGAWVAAEQKHAIAEWRQQFHGDARVVDDTAVTDAQIASSNLVLWGDPGSNSVLAKIAAKLPIVWGTDEIKVGEKKFSTKDFVPVLIYPNPLNPKKYVVLNSGFTYREYDYLNNARQVPKLPDYAIIDLKVAPTSRAPGGIATAGFFGEKWELVSPIKE